MANGKTGVWTVRVARATLAAALLVLLAGPFIKFGVLSWKAGLAMFAVAALLAGIGGIVCLVALLRRRRGSLTVLAAAAGLAAVIVPVAIVADASGAPRIHDITTDTADPPQFTAITPALRGADSNSIVYDSKNAALQAAAFPKLATLVIAAPPAAAFDRALAAAKGQGWAIVAADAASGRIEATDTVPWWGFKDDVVVRLAADGAGTRIDVRSVSRVGEGDLGVNARRISNYLGRLKA